MMRKVITEKQDLTNLKWSHIIDSGGITGTFLKSQSVARGEKIYYKLSNFDAQKGIVGHECVNEIIADRLLTVLGVEHLEYQLIHADVKVDGKVYDTWLCASKDFRNRGESKAALDNYYHVNKKSDESPYEFCADNGWGRYIDTMLAFDYLILNRDRHGANIEVLRNRPKHTIRLAPLFDHGLSFLCSCHGEKEAEKFDVMEDKPCNSFIGGRSAFENLKLIENKNYLFKSKLKPADKEFLFEDLSYALSKTYSEKIWDMLCARWREYEKLCDL